MQKALEVVDGGSMTDPHRSLLIRGGRIVDPANAFDDVADLLIEEGKVTGIGRSLSAPGAPVLDASGLLVAPGGRLLTFLQPGPGINLAAWVNRSVGLTGPRGFNQDLQADLLQIQSIRPVRLRR